MHDAADRIQTEASSSFRSRRASGLTVSTVGGRIIPSHPPGKHTIFGRVYSGMSIVRRMGMVETNKEDR